MDWQLLQAIGRKVYKCEDWRDYKRYYVFLARCKLHQKALEAHLDFFKATPERTAIMHGCPWLIDQATRQIFFKDSSFGERAWYIQKHLLYMEQLFRPEILEALYVRGERVPLWRDEFEGKPLVLYLVFRNGQQKEGCLSIELVYDSLDLKHVSWDYGTHVYQIMFSLGDGIILSDQAQAASQIDLSKLEIGIGALQGLAGGEDMIRKLTKFYFGYRPKNLILWCLRCLAETIGAQKIITVSNAGYYAMNHWRLDRKIKVDLNRFWEEAGGKMGSDKRFYEIPIAEYRKDMSELKPSKRAQHRRRFEKLDAVKAEIDKNLRGCMK